jgi:Tfp pilus assembly protein PilO
MDRLWMIGGLLAAAVLFAVAWFFLINPRNSEIDDLHAQALSAQDRSVPLLNRLKVLRQQNAELQRYRDELDQRRVALPTTSELPAFLRQLQTAGEASAVSVDGLTVGTPTQVTTAGTRVHALPVTVTAVGAAGNLNGFLDKLQQEQARAALITKADLTISDQQSLRDRYDLSLTLQVFVAPPSAAQASPAPNTK